MTQNLSPVTPVVDQLEALQRERAEHVARIEEIDTRVAKVAELLGIDLGPLLTAKMLPRLKREDKRTLGTLGEAMLNALLSADRGYSRTELKAEVRKNPKFAAQLNRNANAFYNNVVRYIRTGKIVEMEGLLYHPDRAPLPEGEEDPTGQHLPANVSPLFAGRDLA